MNVWVYCQTLKTSNMNYFRNVDSVATIHITDTNANLRIHKLIIVIIIIVHKLCEKTKLQTATMIHLFWWLQFWVSKSFLANWNLLILNDFTTLLSVSHVFRFYNLAIIHNWGAGAAQWWKHLSPTCLYFYEYNLHPK